MASQSRVGLAERKALLRISGDSLRVHFTFSGFDVRSETREEQNTLRSIFELLKGSQLVEGAGIACQQLPKSIVANQQRTPSECSPVE